MFLENVVNDSAHYTGLPGEMLKILFEFVKAKASRLIKWKVKKTAKYKQEKKSSARIHKTSTWAKLSVYEQFIFTLVRIKRFPSLKMLCDLFGMSETVGSSIFLTWVKFLEKELKLFIPFTTLKDMEGITRPKVYESNPCLRAIIDCTEFYIQKPSLPSSQCRTHSNYKGRNTFKLFISMSPLLHINYISTLFSGCISDKEIIKRCGFLEELAAGDEVMADKGFNIQDLLALQHVRLISPSIMHKGNVGTGATTMTRRVATKRIHIERIIQRLKSFSILQGVVPLTMKSYIDSVVSICAALVNLQPQIIASP
ncbi:uncharacterized protein LOC124437435 [Xenia sp. Carnegie-2017]|uniref:uncharacterized protein LOC124437435 n=1 Tax=Xenia sp. Carnegie-2017 TaxID=2897299 RepID=UPI001F033306|nr:uncharacterized protein LOC124437435 [Xenia sp. Carnegie-2017]